MLITQFLSGTHYLLTNIFAYWSSFIQYARNRRGRYASTPRHFNEAWMSLLGAHSRVFLTYLLKFALVFMKQYTYFQKKVNNFVTDVTIGKITLRKHVRREHRPAPCTRCSITAGSGVSRVGTRNAERGEMFTKKYIDRWS